MKKILENIQNEKNKTKNKNKQKWKEQIAIKFYVCFTV